MKKSVALIILLILSITTLHAQKEGANWRFGNKAGLDFSNGTPQYLSNSKLISYEGCSAISDSSGNLLFYTNGKTVWNTNNDTIAENLDCCVTTDIGVGPYKGTSSTQGVLMLSGANELYWVFTISDSSKAPNYDPYISAYLRYHIIDKKKNNGKGAIIEKNVIAYDIGARSEKLAAVRHANGRDWWLVVQNHKNGLDYYYKFIFEPNNNNLYFHNLQTHESLDDKPFGQMTFNLEGSRLALVKMSSFNDKVILWNFNRCTGQLTSHLDLSGALPNQFGPYGVAFSPKSTRLYVGSALSSTQTIGQFTLTTTDILASYKVIHYAQTSTSMNLNAMRLGLDEKIYISFAKFPANISDSLNNHLSIIAKPEEEGVACGLALHSFYLGPGAGLVYGLPNIPNYALGPLYDIPLSDAGPDKCITLGTPTQIGTPAVPGTLYRWRPAVGLSDSTAAQPLAAPDVTTTYTLSVINEAGDSCYFNQDIVTVYVTHFPNDFSVVIDGFNASFTNSGGQNLNYLWKFGDGDSSFLKSPAHIYPDTGNYTVTLLLTDTLSGCQKVLTQTLHISVSSTELNNATKENSFRLYPNPADETVSIEHDYPNASIEILTPLGKVVHTQNAPKPKTNIDLRRLAKGVYYLKLYTNLNQFLAIKKLIIH